MKLIDLVPSSIRDDPQVQAACEAIDIELELVFKEIPQLAFWGGTEERANLEKVVPPLLDVLMWEYHVDIHQMLIAMEGEQGLSDALKRKLLNESILWHQKKGTKWIIEHALAVLFEKIQVVEWYEYGGDPYFFRIVTSSALNDPHLYQKVLQVVYELKNVRSWLEAFIIAKLSLLNLWEAEVRIKRVTTRVFMMNRPLEIDTNIWVGVSTCIYKIIRIEAGDG